MAASTPEPDYAYCEELVRRDDPDRWLASLFMPQAARPHAHALYAFSLEIARVREVVSEPMLGEIRFQWWRDLLEGAAQGEAMANPVAAALLQTIERCGLPRAALIQLVEARSFDLYDDPMPSMSVLEAYARHTSSALFDLVARILAPGSEALATQAAEHAGIAYAVTGLLRAFPWHAARGRVYIPAEMLAAHGLDSDGIAPGFASSQLGAALAEMRALARRHLADMHVALPSKAARSAAGFLPAFLPAQLCEAYLRRMEKPDYHPFETPIMLAQWRRQWILWRAARKFG